MEDLLHQEREGVKLLYLLREARVDRGEVTVCAHHLAGEGEGLGDVVSAHGPELVRLDDEAKVCELDGGGVGHLSAGLRVLAGTDDDASTECGLAECFGDLCHGYSTSFR